MKPGALHKLRPLDARPSAAAPIFIVGIERRSGTNYFQKLLSLHPGLRAFAIPEDTFVASSWVLDLFVDLVRVKNQEWVSREGFDDILVSGLGSGLLQVIEAQSPGKRAVLKTPSAKGLRGFFRLFPHCPLLILVRDGRAVTESHFRTWGGRKEKIMSLWAEGAAEIVKFKNLHPEGDKYLVVRYENLVKEVESEMKKILDFLRLDPKVFPFEKARELPVIGSSTYRDKKCPWNHPKKTGPAFDPLARFSHWKPSEHQRFNRVAGTWSRKLGYPIHRPKSALPPK
jgi:hypothetical protein